MDGVVCLVDTFDAVLSNRLIQVFGQCSLKFSGFIDYLYRLIILDSNTILILAYYSTAHIAKVITDFISGISLHDKL